MHRVRRSVDVGLQPAGGWLMRRKPTEGKQQHLRGRCAVCHDPWRLRVTGNQPIKHWRREWVNGEWVKSQCPGNRLRAICLCVDHGYDGEWRVGLVGKTWVRCDVMRSELQDAG